MLPNNPFNSACFLSDIHLERSADPKLPLLLQTLQQHAVHTEALFILGDLFDVWVGDDDQSPAYQALFNALQQLVAIQIQVFFLPGNRDFLWGRSLAAKLGVQLIDEYHHCTIAGQAFCLMHGDLLCTDDVEYQKFRRQVRSPAWQQDFLAKPLSQRQQIATELRQRSQTQKAQKRYDIMDVNNETVRQTLAQHPATILLHGHTHRPGCQRYEIDGKTRTRLTLGDWRDNASSFAILDAQGLRMRDPRINLDLTQAELETI